MLRAIVLSLALLIGIGTLIPLATDFAEAGSQSRRKYKKTKVKRYSKRWWRNRARQKRVRQARIRRKRQARIRRARAKRIRRARAARLRRARAARLRRARAARSRQARAAKVRRSKRSKVRRTAVAQNRKYSRSRSRARRRANRTLAPSTNYTRSVVALQPDQTAAPVQPVSRQSKNAQPLQAAGPAFLPTGTPAPHSWRSQGVVQGELKFSVNDNSGVAVGAASIAVIGQASADPPIYSSRTKTVGGITTTALRRTVIDQMIRENGWVVNDYQKEIGGQNVYVVVAQAPGANNQVENRMFYFTEVEGKIYSVATKAPEKASEKLEQDSENVIASLRGRPEQKVEVAVNRTVSNLVANEE